MAALTLRMTSKFFPRTVSLHLKKLILLNTCSPNRQFSKTCILSNRKYSEKHEWITIDGNIGTVGVSNYAQEALGDVVYVQTPEIDQTIGRDEEAGVIESVKAVNEIYSPVSGKVTEINESLADKPRLINESCYDKGWIYKLELTDLKEVDSLMEEEAYQTYLKSIH
ncbi:glycine cleavage system H protein, mitochondrial [Trichonephila inaurata madagascariensis]|uniref:Glycine cleavage system H protein n=1 Tax=Trichonephila inaurata madagascariensis TaxID=2747483 RepID=A0A8X6Y312_9ARAC|nr:glycine cleavage system H protein, mitochondrial [Trichonephila inaurata madagascariensis]